MSRTELVRDPAAGKLIEWMVLRNESNGADFTRYAAFVRDAARPADLAAVLVIARGYGGFNAAVVVRRVE